MIKDLENTILSLKEENMQKQEIDKNDRDEI